jgi:hemerythrin-like domain-containing protein
VSTAAAGPDVRSEPMKRHESLIPLSRDHHQALHRALKLKRADEAGAAEAVRDVLEFFDGHGALHFRVEEEVLFPYFVRVGGADPSDEAIVRPLTDHVWIRARVAALREEAAPTVIELHQLGERLDDHIRYEERVLFPAIEEALTAEQLAELGRAVAAAEAAGV